MSSPSRPETATSATSATSTGVARHEVVVVGGGPPGLGQVIVLRRAGVDDVVVLEQAERLGGTGRGDDLDHHLRSGVEVVGATWDEDSATWTVRTRSGERFVTRFVVDGASAVEGDPLDVVGRGGRTLAGVWGEHGIATHLGITVSDFPNLFLLLGPGTDPQRDAADLVVACRTRYVAQAISAVREAGMRGLDVRAEVQQRSAAARRRLTAGVGRTARTARPGSTVRYWARTRRFRPSDFEFFGRAGAVGEFGEHGVVACGE